MKKTQLSFLFCLLLSLGANAAPLNLPSPSLCKQQLHASGAVPLERLGSDYLQNQLLSELKHLSKKQRNQVIDTLKTMLVIRTLSPRAREAFAKNILKKYNVNDRAFFYEAMEADAELIFELETYVSKKSTPESAFIEYPYRAALSLLKHSLKAGAYLMTLTLLNSGLYSLNQVLEEKEADDALGREISFFEKAANLSSRESQFLKEIALSSPKSFSLLKSKEYKLEDTFELASGQKLLFYSTSASNGIEKIVVSINKIKNLDDGYHFYLLGKNREFNKIYSFKSDRRMNAKFFVKDLYPEKIVHENGNLEQITRLIPKLETDVSTLKETDYDVLSKNNFRASHVNIGIFDSGIDYGRKDLTSRGLFNKREIPLDGIDNDQNGFVDDFFGYSDAKDNIIHDFPWEYHGTSVAEIALKGSSKIRFVPFYSLGALNNLEKSLEYLMSWNKNNPNNKIRVVNLSFTTKTLTKKVLNLFKQNQDVLFVAGSGNDQEGSGGNHAFPAEMNIPNLITVGSINKEGQVSDFSGRGPNTDLFAIGEQVYVENAYGKKIPANGTSVAAPQVTNTAAKMLLFNPELKPAELKSIILSTVSKRDYLKGASSSSGILNPGLAISAVLALR